MKNALGAILLLAGGLGVCEPLEAAKFSGRLLKMTAATKEDSADAQEQWKAMPGMFVDFTTTKAGPAVATFCGVVGTQEMPFTDMAVRVLEPGVGDWKPGQVQFDGAAPSFKARCFSWFATLPAGTHRIKVLFKKSSSGSSQVNSRSFRVQHEN